MKTNLKRILIGALGALAVLCLVAGTTAYKSRLIARSSSTNPTCATATGDGDICAEDAIEANGALDVGGASTLTGAVTMTASATVGTTLGVTGILTPSGGTIPPASTVTTAYTGSTADCGETVDIATDGVTVVLPAVATANRNCCITVRHTGADNASYMGFSVNASDAIFGTIQNAAADSVASGTDDEAWALTKATSNKGDWATVCSNGSTGWYVTGGVGIFTSVAQ